MIERIVMESLSEGGKNEHQLHLDTKLDFELIHNILSDFETEALVEKKDGFYFLKMDKVRQIIDETGIKREVKELFVSWVNRFFVEEKQKNTCLKVKKVAMNDAEELLYNEHLAKLNTFLENIKKASKREKRNATTANKKVVFWGHGEYQGLIESSLNSL